MGLLLPEYLNMVSVLHALLILFIRLQRGERMKTFLAGVVTTVVVLFVYLFVFRVPVGFPRL